MCGRLNITDDPFVTALVEQLGIVNPTEKIRYGRFKRATDTISIIRQVNGQNQIDDATWWLLLEQTASGFKPSRYTSFNTRYDKLNVFRSAGYQPFRETRCIIPAKGFGETEFKNKKPLHYYDFETVSGEAMAFGGLYKQWVHPKTGEYKLSCSIITLPPHKKIAHIHSKAMPLIMPLNTGAIDEWLNSSNNNTIELERYLTPFIPQSLKATPINRPSEFCAIGEAEVIAAD